MATRVRIVLNGLVDEQYTRFLKVRDIMDNLMTFRLAKEIATARLS